MPKKEEAVLVLRLRSEQEQKLERSSALVPRSRLAQEQELERFSALALRLRWVREQELARSPERPRLPQPPHSRTSSSSLCHHPADQQEQPEPAKSREQSLQLWGQQPQQQSRSKQKNPLRQVRAQQPAVQWKPRVVRVQVGEHQLAQVQPATIHMKGKTCFPQDWKRDKKDRSPYSARLPDSPLPQANRRTLNKTDFLLDYPHHKRDIPIMPGWT